MTLVGEGYERDVQTPRIVVGKRRSRLACLYLKKLPFGEPIDDNIGLLVQLTSTIDLKDQIRRGIVAERQSRQ